MADNHYHCYACGEHGDSIDLVASLFGLPLYDAEKKLTSDFGLAPDKPPNKNIQNKQKRESEAQHLNEYCRLLQNWKTVYSPPTPAAPIDRHEYRRILHQGLTEYYTDLYNQYKGKYFEPILAIKED